MQTNPWHPDLSALGYDNQLPAPSAAVQATIASIDGPAIHAYVQEMDNTSFLDKDDDGEHAPLLLTTLDLSHWTSIMLASTLENGVEKALSRLREAHALLAVLLEKDELELEEALNNTRVVETALRAANPHEDWSDRPQQTRAAETMDALHPMVGRLNIPDAQKAAIEDYGDSIQSSQMESELASLDASGKGPAIPFLPPRTVEVRLNARSHRTWCLNNINLLAPIPPAVWKVWGNLSEVDMKNCEDRALNGIGPASQGNTIANAFPLALYDHNKCPTSSVLVHTKQDVLTCSPRHPQHTSKLWNCRRPYLRCACSQNAKIGCKGNMMWFDHSVWYMLNNLDRFFDARYPSLAAKYGAFLTWMSAACSVAIKAQVTFCTFRQLMQTAALELAMNPTEKMLSKYGNAAGARQIERLFKPAAFSLETTPSPSPASYSKRRRLNINVAADEHYQQHRQHNSAPRNRMPDQRPTQSAGGRGRYNKNFRPPQRATSRFMDFPNPPGQISPSAVRRNRSPNLDRTPPSATASSVTIRPWSPLKGRVLNWDNV